VSERALVLLTNDDGIDAPGLHALEVAFESLGEVWVVAPATEQSGVSSSLSLHDPVRVKRFGERRMAVTGTPVDCVYMALQHLLPRQPAICVSGINIGANLGDDVLYSGTVAAAMEATLCDVPAVAVSHAARGRQHDFSAAAQIARRVAEEVLARGLPREVLLNVNVPRGVSAEAPLVVSRLGRRNYERRVTEQRDPRGGAYYWIGGAEIDFDDLPGSDCNAVAAGHASISPVHVDMTHYRFMRELREWSITGS
jgi:5'-nucleotidase